MPPRAKAKKAVSSRRARPRAVKKAKPAARAGRVSSAAMRRQRAKRQPSSLERQVYAMLAELGIKYEREKKISACSVDIFIGPRTVIELQGCFWHGCLSCNKKLTADQKKWQENDGRRHFFLRSAGFDVIQIWEHEVEQEPERVMRMLAALGN